MGYKYITIIDPKLGYGVTTSCPTVSNWTFDPKHLAYSSLQNSGIGPRKTKHAEII
jgi:hypothetical protein